MNRQSPIDNGAANRSKDFEPGALVHPTEHDIILGRGVLHASHPGNVRFYRIIDNYLPLYEEAKTRAEKTKVVQAIYDTITSIGRFVKDDAASAACVVIEIAAAKKKISHAIRFRRQAKKSFSKEARKNIPRPSQTMPVPPNVNTTVPCPQPTVPELSLNDYISKARQNQHSSLQQSPFIQTDFRDSTDAESIIPDEELESVLLPPDEMELASQIYNALVWSDLSDNDSETQNTSTKSSASYIQTETRAHKSTNHDEPLSPLRHSFEGNKASHPSVKPLILPDLPDSPNLSEFQNFNYF